MDTTTIKLYRETKSELDLFREYKNESYDEVIRKLVYIARTAKTEPWRSKETVRAIEAYERLMDRYMDLTGTHLTTVGMDLRNIVTRLDSIDARLTELDSRLMKIEQVLVTDKANKPAVKYPVNADRPVNTLR